MTNPIATARDFSQEQVALIRKSIAPTATPEEFELFIYRCKHMDLDPLKPGQIHFIKYERGVGTIVVGIEGFRVRAAKTGKHSGTKRGVLRDENRKCVGAWCEVYRSDWSQPAREEVSLHEYFRKGKDKPSQWEKMPETMIKKVAECAALRMAFPDELGGMYERAEMDQAEARDVIQNSEPIEDVEPEIENELSPVPSAQNTISLPLADPGEYVIKLGQKYKGQKLNEVGLPDLQRYVHWLEDTSSAQGQSLSHSATVFRSAVSRYQEFLQRGAK